MPPKRGEKKKPKKVIMIGNKDINEMSRAEIELHVKKMVKTIYVARKNESNLRREIDLIRTLIDNTREKLNTKRDYKYLALNELDIPDPKFNDQLQEAREHLKYLDYNILEIGKERKKRFDQEELQLKEVKDLQVEKLLWENKEKYEEELEEVNKACRLEIDEGDPAAKQKLADFRKRRTVLLNERNKRAKILHEKYKSWIKVMQFNSYTCMKSNCDLFWKKYRKQAEIHYKEVQNIDQLQINRIIHSEYKSSIEIDELQDKIYKIKDQIFTNMKEADITVEEADLLYKKIGKMRRNAKNLIKEIELSDLLEVQIKAMTNEKQSLINETKELINKKNIFLDDISKFMALLTVCWRYNKIDFDKRTKYVVLSLFQFYEYLCENVYSELYELTPELDSKGREVFLRSFLFYVDCLNEVKTDVAKDVKRYNNMIDYADAYFKQMKFYNPVPFEKTYERRLSQDRQQFTEKSESELCCD